MTLAVRVAIDNVVRGGLLPEQRLSARFRSVSGEKNKRA